MASSVVQNKHAFSDGTGATVAVTFDSTATSGNLLVLGVMTGASSITTPSGWSVGVTQASGEAQYAGIYYKISNGTETGVTVTCSGTEVHGASFIEITEPAASPLDKSNSASPGTTSTTISPGTTGVLSQALEFVFVFTANWIGDQTATIDSGFTELHDTFDGSGQLNYSAYLYTSTTAALNPTVTYTASDDGWGIATIATFKLQSASITELDAESTGTSSASGNLYNGGVEVAELIGPVAAYRPLYESEYPKALETQSTVVGELTADFADRNECRVVSYGQSSATGSLSLIGAHELFATPGGASGVSGTLSTVTPASAFRVSLTDPSTPGNQSLSHSITIRGRTTSGTASVLVKLWEGASLRHQFETDAFTTSWTPYASTLLQAEGEAISNYANLEIEVIPQLQTENATIQISFLDLYVPPADSSGAGNYQTSSVGWDATEYSILGLAPGSTYDVGVRAVDIYGNASTWVSSVETASGDTIAPSTPAGPTMAGSARSLQVTHYLGLASGGTFNLESDLDHLNVYLGTNNGFNINDGSLLGQIPATASNLRLQIPVVGTFQAPSDSAPSEVGGAAETRWVAVTAVDRAGNESAQSATVSVTAELIDGIWIDEATISDAHISYLSADTITAGTLSADLFGVGTITGLAIATGSDGIDTDNLVDGSVSSVKFASTLQSDVFSNSPPYSGWRILRAGSATFNDVTIRGTLATNLVTGWLTTNSSGGFATGASGTNRITMGGNLKDRIKFEMGSGGSTYTGFIQAENDLDDTGEWITIAGPGQTSTNYASIKVGLFDGWTPYISLSPGSNGTLSIGSGLNGNVYMNSPLTGLDTNYNWTNAGRIRATTSTAALPGLSVFATSTGVHGTAAFVYLQRYGSTVISGNGVNQVYLGGMYPGSSTYAVESDGSQIFYDTSSRRFKKNITDAKVDPDTVMAWRPRRFEYKGPYPGKHVWYIAEEIHEASGEQFVTRDPKGLIANTKQKAMIVAMVEKIKQLDSRVGTLERGA